MLSLVQENTSLLSVHETLQGPTTKSNREKDLKSGAVQTRIKNWREFSYELDRSWTTEGTGKVESSSELTVKVM